MLQPRKSIRVRIRSRITEHQSVLRYECFVERVVKKSGRSNRLRIRDGSPRARNRDDKAQDADEGQRGAVLSARHPYTASSSVSAERDRLRMGAPSNAVCLNGLHHGLEYSQRRSNKSNLLRHSPGPVERLRRSVEPVGTPGFSRRCGPKAACRHIETRLPCRHHGLGRPAPGGRPDRGKSARSDRPRGVGRAIRPALRSAGRFSGRRPFRYARRCRSARGQGTRDRLERIVVGILRFLEPPLAGIDQGPADAALIPSQGFGLGAVRTANGAEGAATRADPRVSPKVSKGLRQAYPTSRRQ